MPSTTSAPRQAAVVSAPRLTLLYDSISFTAFAVGFLWPFWVSHYVGMPLYLHPWVAVGNGILWVFALILAYFSHRMSRHTSVAEPRWVKVSVYITSSPATFIMLAILFAFLYAPTLEKSLIANWMSYWLMLSLFVMGIQITTADWSRIFQHPKMVSVAVLTRWICMPLFSYFVAHAILLRFLHPPAATALAVGLVIVGTTPTGAASNTLTLISRGELALSVSVTTINSLLAPFLQPLLIKLFVGSTTRVNAAAIFLDLVKLIVVPVVLGSAIGCRFPTLVKKAKPILGAIAVVCLALIMVGTVSKGTAVLLKYLWVLPVLTVACVCQGLAGLSAGYYLPKLFGFNDKQRIASCFEVGVENAALSVVVAINHFSPLAAIPAVFYGKLQNMLAISLFVRKFQKADDREGNEMARAASLSEA